MIDSAQSGAESKSGYVGEKRLDNVPSSGVRGDWARLQGRTWGLQGHAEASEQALLRDRGRQGVGVSADRLRQPANRRTGQNQLAGQWEQAASRKPQPQGQGGPETGSAKHRDQPQRVGVPGPQRRVRHGGEKQGSSVMPRKPGGGAETHLGLLR